MKYIPVASVTIPYPDAEAIQKIETGALLTIRVGGELENFQVLQYKSENGTGFLLVPLPAGK